MKHAAVHGEPAKDPGDAEAHSQVQNDGGQDHALRRQPGVLKPVQEQERQDRGQDAKQLARRPAAVAVQVGQHAGDAAESTRQEGRRPPDAGPARGKRVARAQRG
jgi:hypothetical protein